MRWWKWGERAGGSRSRRECHAALPTSGCQTQGGGHPVHRPFNSQTITAGPAPTGNTFAHRLNINNGTGSEAVYTADLGDTVYANGASNRGLVIGSGTPNSGESSIGAITEVADAVWEKTASRKTWTFEESTGELSVTDAPGDDYDDWSDVNELAGGPTDDDDGDGLTNFGEYAFGLNPNSGTSVNPISQSLDKSTGQFKYTRRTTPETSGVSYTYESSTGLRTWPAFTPVSAVSNNASPVEEVTVTVPAELLAHPARFIRVKAAKP